MKTAIIGGVAAVIGLVCLVIWRLEFLTLLAGAVPVMLFLGGCLAIYMGVDELKDKMKKDDTASCAASETEDVEKYKREIEELKKEVESLKK